MSLMLRLSLSFSPLVIGYLFTMLLSGNAQIEIYEQISAVKESGFPTLERALALRSHLEMVFVKLDDATVRDPISAKKSVQDARKHINQGAGALDQLISTADQSLQPKLASIHALIKRELQPLQRTYESVILEGAPVSSVDELQWELYQRFPPIRSRLEALKEEAKRRSRQQMDEVIDESTRLFDRSLLVFIIVLLTSIFFVYLALTRSIVRPIQSTSALLEQLSLGRLDLRQQQTGTDEIGRMHAALNQFISQLEEKVNHLSGISGGDLEGDVQLASEQDTLGEAIQEMQQSLLLSHRALTREAEEHKRSRLALEETQAQLIQSEKMSSLGQLVAGIAHEINNPVNFLQSNFYAITQALKEVEALLWDILPEDEEVLEIRDAFAGEFKKISKYGANHEVGTRRLAEIVSSLKSFTRHDQAEVQHVFIADIINDTLVILHNKLKAISFEIELESTEQLYCHPSQLGQVMLNLIGNAIYAAEKAKGSGAVVSVHSRDIEEHIEVRICDNGGGIPQEAQSKIFDPFFTTKPVGEGTGLGLSICYRIVETHRGTLAFESSESGTTFTLSIPLNALRAEF